nr:zinc finger, CCHC-type, retrotransposon Gag domain protein [Tanacetum cinerariifolium]
MNNLCLRSQTNSRLVKLKRLNLEYAFLEGDNKLPVIIAKELGEDITVFFTKRGVTIMVSKPGFETVGSKDLTCEDCRTDAELSAAVQNALQTLLPQIRAEIREEFRTSSGPSNSGGNPPPVTIHTWLERFNKQNPRSFEKETAPVDVENWISHMEKIFDVMGSSSSPTSSSTNGDNLVGGGLSSNVTLSDSLTFIGKSCLHPIAHTLPSFSKPAKSDTKATLAIPINPIGVFDVEDNQGLKLIDQELVMIQGLGLKIKECLKGLESSSHHYK